MERESESPEAIAQRRDVYRFQSSPDLVVALGTTGLESLVSIRESLGLQLDHLQGDIAHLDVAIERRVIDTSE